MIPLIAGGAALAGGLYSDWRSGERAREAADIQKGYLDDIQAERQGAYDDVAGMYGYENELGQSALRDLAGGDFTTQINEFGFDKGVDDYLDPSMDFQRQQMEKSLQSSAAAQGGLYSGAAMKALQDRGTQLAQTDYSNAYNRMNTDRSQAYNQYLDDFNQRRLNNATRQSSLQNLVNMGQNAKSTQANARMGFSNQMAGLNTCLLYTSPSPRDGLLSRMPSSA